MRRRLPSVDAITNEEMQRILDLPLSEIDEDSWQDLADEWTAQLERPGHNKFELRGVQGAVLQEVHDNVADYFVDMDRPEDDYGQPLGPRGLLGPIGVGHGKTGPTFLIGEVVRQIVGTVRVLLIVPPDLVEKTERAYATWAKYYRFPRPEILSMGKLSHPSSTARLEQLKPNVIVIDEAHKFAGMDSARTKRLMRYIVNHRETVVCMMSGTLTSKSMEDYRHLAEMCLRECVPIPQETTDLELWQAMIDVGGMPNRDAKMAIRPLVNWSRARAGEPPVSASRITKEMARDAFSDRLRGTPGVISTSDSSCSASLIIRKWIQELPPSWEKAVDQFDADDEDALWEMPDGDEIIDALGAARAKVQLSSGYFTRWVWPTRCSECHKEVKKNGKLSCGHTGADIVKGPDEEWRESRRKWNATERAILKNEGGGAGLDSPALIRDLAREGKFGGTKRSYLLEWEAMKPRYRHNGLWQPPVEYVNLDPGPEWLAGRAKQWAKVMKRGIIWYATPHVGRALHMAGIPTFGAGTNLETPMNLRLDIVAAKIDVQGTGKNLQQVETGKFACGWANNLFLEYGGNARTMEQVLGRTHRLGQIMDEVRADFFMAGDFRKKSMSSVKIGAKYIERTMQMKQKMNIATYGDDIWGRYKI